MTDDYGPGEIRINDVEADAADFTLPRRYARLPAYMEAPARRYIENGINPGGFLTAVLCNDLVGAFARADSANHAHMHEWAKWLHNDIPAPAWGSPEKVKAWIERGGLAGKEESP